MSWEMRAKIRKSREKTLTNSIFNELIVIKCTSHERLNRNDRLTDQWWDGQTDRR